MIKSRIPAPRAILFDWDNTLVDAWPAIHDAINATFEAMGHELWTIEETRTRVRKSLRDSFPEMFGDRWTEARRIFYKRYAEIHIDALTPLPHAEQVLHWLAGRDIYLAVVSNKAGDYLREEARHLGWDGYFKQIVGATDATHDKPSKAPVDLALRDSGIEADSDVWFVGDGAIDVQCAVNSGLTPVLIMYDGTEEELARHNVVQFVDSKCRLKGMEGLKSFLKEQISLLPNK